MLHEYEADAKLFVALVELDAKCAARIREAGCAECGGPLDRADYDRKPRGDLGEAAGAYTRRISFCCRRKGCRRRATPPSLRFLGRKVYFAVLVVVASIVGRGTDLVGRSRPRHVEGVPVRTVRRWLEWWRIGFARSAFWSEAKGFFAVPVEETELPNSLLERLGEPNTTTLTRLLVFVSPITTTSVRARIAMPM
jgi:hypothetical protein